MFDLDQATACWREQMRAAGLESPTDLDELESHLRDDVERQMQAGVDPKRAFEEAIGRVGKISEVRAEYRRAAGFFGSINPAVLRRCCHVAKQAGFWLLVAAALLNNRILGRNADMADFLWIAFVAWATPGLNISYIPSLDRWWERHGNPRKGFVIASKAYVLLFALYSFGSLAPAERPFFIEIAAVSSTLAALDWVAGRLQKKASSG